MAQIYKVIIRCPRTLKTQDTGIRTSGRESLSGDMYDAGVIRCSQCREFHAVTTHGFLDLERTSLEHDLWRPNP